MSVRGAFEVALAAMAPPLAIAWQNTAFSPPQPPTPYQRAVLMFADPDNPEQGPGFRELGYLQVTLMYPLGTGPAAAEARAELIRQAFPKGHSLTHGAITLTINKTPAIGVGTPDGDRWALPVKIPFHANRF